MAEKEYIEREAFLDAIERMKPYHQDADDIAEMLQNFSAADVRPVVKAKWVYTDMSRLVCSNCGNPVAFALKDDGWHHGDFCPNCGADMRPANSADITPEYVYDDPMTDIMLSER